MLNKILITVRVPMIEKDYDIYIPVSKTIGTTIKLLIKTVNELSEGHFPLDKDCVLMSSSGKVYINTDTIKSSEIKNSDIVILI